MQLDSLIQLIETCPTAWHACEEVSQRLKNAKAVELSEKSTWKLKSGQLYFVRRGGSIAFFETPQKPSSMLLTCAHTDSPCLKIKPKPMQIENGLGFLTTEIYGSPIRSSYLDRDLAIAGLVYGIDQKKNSCETLCFFSHLPMQIPSLAIHLQNKEPTQISTEGELKALVAQTDDPEYLQNFLKKELKLKEIHCFDLFLVPNECPQISGLDQSLISSYRLDNLASCFVALESFLAAKKSKEQLSLGVLFNHEEIGSMTNEGAQSPFLDTLIERITLSLGMDREEMLCLKANGLCLSLDNAHAFHPLHKKEYDPQNAPNLGKGFAIKTHAGLRYSSSNQYLQKLIQHARQKKIAYQTFASHSDKRTGSTVGPIVASVNGIATIDLGIPQLAMHSAREVLAIDDIKALKSMLKLAWETSF